MDENHDFQPFSLRNGVQMSQKITINSNNASSSSAAATGSSGVITTAFLKQNPTKYSSM